MDHLFAPGVAQILLALGFLGGLAVGILAGRDRFVGWSDKRNKGIAVEVLKAFVASEELKELVRIIGTDMLTSHQAECTAIHAALKSEQKFLEARDADRKEEMVRTREATSVLTKNVLELATLVARMSGPRPETHR